MFQSIDKYTFAVSPDHFMVLLKKAIESQVLLAQK